MDESKYERLQQLLTIVSTVTGIPEESIRSKRRWGTWVAARILLFNLARRYMRITTVEAHPYFGHTEHTTLIYYMKMHKVHMESFENPNITNELSQKYGAWYNYACDMAENVPELVAGMEEAALYNVRKKNQRI